MKNYLAILFFAVIAAITCDGPLGPENQSTHHASVSVAFNAETVAKSTYKITISGSGMKTIGPLEYAGGQTIELYVPMGTGRLFRFERYDSNSVLIDTGTTLLDIGAGMNAVSAKLISAIPTYAVTYEGNNSTGGMAPPAQTKTKGVALTLALNSGNLVRSGFTFAGWNTAADGSGTGYAEAVSYTSDTVTTLYAKWTPLPTYTVTYIGNGNTGGTVPSPQTKTHGIALALAAHPVDFVKTGFTFSGWNTSADATGTSYAEGVSYTADTITTLYAKWTALPTYSITYDGNGNSGGTVPSPQTKTQGIALTLATNTGILVRPGYTFGGWNTAADGSGANYAEGGSFAVDTTTTLYVKWAALPTYMVGYNGNGNTAGTAPSPQIKMQRVALILASNTGTLVKTGYTFAGWNTAASGNGIDYGENGSYAVDTSAILYAKWTPLPVGTVTYDGNGSSGGAVPLPQTKVQGIALTLASNTGKLVKTGYAFAGWNTAPDGNGFTFAEGGSCTADTISTLYAKWTPLPTCTVTYDGNGSSGGTVPVPQTKIQGIALTLASNTGILVKTGLTFAGWNTAADGIGADYAEGGSYTADTGITLYAKWTTLPTYTVVYDGNNNSGGVVPSPQIKTQGVALRLANNTGLLAKSGFIFAGWNTAADGIGTDYAAGGNYTADTSVTLYAKWAVLTTYTVRYDGNINIGGTVPSPQVKTHGVALTLASNSGNLTKTGYTFAGWNTAADQSGSNYAEGGLYAVDSNTILFAKWTALATYAVTYNGNNNTGGTVPAAQTKTQGVALTLALNSGNLTRTGYTFTGWNTSAADSGADYAPGGSFTADAITTLYAKWAPLPTYTVTYNGNNNTGGTIPSSQTKYQGIALTLASNSGNLVRTGYTFANWNTAATGNGTDYAPGGSYTADAIATLYAKWTALPACTLLYNGNGNTGGTAPSMQTRICGVALTLASNTGNLVKSGNIFSGWNTSPNGTGTGYAEGATFTGDTLSTSTLYAMWVSRCTAPVLPAASGLTTVNAKLPDPFKYYNGSALTSKEDWPCRRAEILAMAEKYLYGPMPPDPDRLTTTVNAGSIGLLIEVGSQTSTLNFTTTGSGDILCMKIIGTGISPSGARIMSFDPATSKTAIANLYGMPNVTGTIAAAWCAKLICAAIDQNPTAGISPDKIMVTGCSGAAKVAMTTGAFCEGIDLTVIVESGGGGASSLRMAEWFRHGGGTTIWNCADNLPQGIDNLETNGVAGPWVSSTAANWLISSPSKVNNLPFDQHLVLACIAPRAVCHVTNQNGPPGEWCYLGGTCEALSAWAAEPVWNALGVPANFGFSIFTEASAPTHCSNPASAVTLASKFFDRVFNGNVNALTDVMTIPAGDVQQPFADWSAMWVDWNMGTTLD